MHVFEKADKLGVDAASVTVTVIKDGKQMDVAIDVPMRSIDAGIPLTKEMADARILSEITATVEGS